MVKTSNEIINNIKKYFHIYSVKNQWRFHSKKARVPQPEEGCFRIILKGFLLTKEYEAQTRKGVIFCVQDISPAINFFLRGLRNCVW